MIVMCYANPILARGLERFADALVEAGASGLIVPDLPLEEAPAVLERVRCAGSRARAAGGADDARGPAGEDRSPARAAFSTRCR